MLISTLIKNKNTCVSSQCMKAEKSQADQERCGANIHKGGATLYGLCPTVVVVVVVVVVLVVVVVAAASAATAADDDDDHTSVIFIYKCLQTSQKQIMFQF